MVPTYTFTGNKDMPAIVTLGEHSTPVWIQQNWKDGKYAQYIRKNGCGHCCTAMALNLNGVKINPHEEFTLCRKMWGEPRMYEPVNEDNFLSVCGIAQVIKSFEINAEYFGVPYGKCEECAKHIEDALKKGKVVIFWSHPSEKLAHNPFSPGEHYVLAVGISDGKILIANSTDKCDAAEGIQYTDCETVSKAFWEGCDPWDFTWGRYNLEHNGGYVIVG